MAGKKRIKLPSAKELKSLLDYDKTTGKLTWKPRTPEMFNETDGRDVLHTCAQWNARWAGKPAMEKKWGGYKIGRINYQYVAAHRVIWKMMTGEDPDVIDHINGDGFDNRFVNLRNVDESGNRKNTRRRVSGRPHPGVMQDKRNGKWIALIQIGTFDRMEDAIAARKEAERLLGYHPNHGREAA